MEVGIKAILDHKGVEPVILEVKNLCSFADYFLVVAGTSRRHVLALAQHLEEALAKAGAKPLGVEGLQEGQWVLMDYNDVVIHIFLQPLREFYNLEGLWAEAPHTIVQGGAYGLSPSPSTKEGAPGPDSGSEPIRHE